MARSLIIAGMLVSLLVGGFLTPARAVGDTSTADATPPEMGIRVAQGDPPQTPASIYKNNIHGVFTIRSDDALGSGFTFAPGLIATNAHVVGNSTTVEVEEQDGTKFTATVIHADLKRDYAILRPDGIRPFTTVLPLLLGNTPAIGENIVVIGSPGGLKGTVTTGIVSQIYPDGMIQLNVSVNPGNSGGPVFDHEGRVIGVATLKYSKGDGLGFAIPIGWLQSPALPK
jgi:S1-C subfamily serine protease